MTRQFFVGGNWKLNPISKAAKASIVDVLNKATLDPNTGGLNSFTSIIVVVV